MVAHAEQILLLLLLSDEIQHFQSNLLLVFYIYLQFSFYKLIRSWQLRDSKSPNFPDSHILTQD